MNGGEWRGKRPACFRVAIVGKQPLVQVTGQRLNRRSLVQYQCLRLRDLRAGQQAICLWLRQHLGLDGANVQSMRYGKMLSRSGHYA
jgi:hypothetical protein